MPVYNVRSPDGQLYRVTAPEGATEDQIIAFAQSQMGQFNAPKPQEGIGAALTGGFKRFLSSGETTLESLIDPELAAQRGAERSERLGEQYAPGANLERVKQVYEQKGLFPAAKEVVSQIPTALAEQTPNIAATFAAARTGAMAGAPLGPMGALIGGLAGASLPSLVQLYSANLERQFEEKTPEISRAGALGAAVPGAALEVASQFIPMGRGLVGKLLGPNAEKALARGSNEAIERAAKESLASSLATGTITGALAEIPTEVAQQMLERYQAGLSLTDEAAQKEYGEAAYGAALVGGPFGAAARGLGRPGARAEFEKIQQEEAKRLAVPEEELAKLFPEGVLPGGFRIDREEVSREMAPAGYSIMAEGRDEPLSIVDTAEEAQAKLESLTKIRQQEAEKLLGEEQKINAEVDKAKARLEQLEATEQTGSDEYRSLKTELPTMMEQSAQKISDLYERNQTLTKPLRVEPLGEVERVNEQFKVVDQAGQAIGTFKTLGEAEAAVKDVVGSEEFDRKIESQQVAKQLYQTFVPQMRKFGLGDVGLNIVDRIENGAGGEYLNKLIKISLEEQAPVQTMRHESLHALKDLGFFSDQQWKALEERAKKEWIKEYLEGEQTEIDGKQMSRLEGYRELGKRRNLTPEQIEQEIIEEAIADAFGAYDKGVKPPPGLIAALYKKLKNFFANLGQALRGAGFQSAEDIFQQVERGQLKPAAVKATAKEKKSLGRVPRSTREIMESDTKFAQHNLGLQTEKKKGATGANNVRDIGVALNNQTISEQGQITGTSIQDARKLGEAIADEVGWQLRSSAKTGTGLGWYSNNYPKALTILGNRFPELKTSRHARSVFSAVVAVTSNGEDVSTNIKNAIKLYEDLRDDKKINATGSRRPTALENNLIQIQSLLEKYGSNFEKELMRVITVADMNAYLRSIGEKSDGAYLKDTKIPAAAIYFGPKLGAFYANLMGAEGYLTMDMWWTRSINRMRGLLKPQATESSINTFKDLIDQPNISRDKLIEIAGEYQKKYEDHNYMTGLEFVTGLGKEPSKKDEKEAWFKRAEAAAGDAFDQLLFEHRLEKISNTIYKNEVEMLKEDPFNASDRKFMYDAAKIAQAKLKEEGVPLSIADIQAALWYYEKRLYAKLSGRIADDIGYEEAIISSAAGAGRARPSVVFTDKSHRWNVPRKEGAVPDQSGGKPEKEQKLSIKRGVLAEVAPNPDHIAADKWREMTPAERLDATKAVANKVITPIFGELNLKGYSFDFSSGKFEGEVNPNIIIKAPKDASIEQLDELARAVGYVLDQKSMVTFDEENTTSGTQAGFVKVIVPKDMTTDQVTGLREHIAREVPQASGDTLRDGELVYGNFSEYDPSVDTLSDEQYHQAIMAAVESFDYDGTIRVSDPDRFHSDLIEPETRSGYLEGTRYGEGREIQGEEGADVRRQGRRRLENLAEQAIVLRDRWIDARGAARLGGRERPDAKNFGEPTAEYGSPRADAVSAVGVHFSKQFRPQLSSSFFGTGLRGMENERLSGAENSDLRNRLYFYVNTGSGIRPEAGVGGVPHVIKLNNLYDVTSDPLQIAKTNRGESSAERANNLERKIMDAGFDGMLVRDSILPQGYAILYGKHNIKTEGKLSLKRVSFPTVKEAKEAVEKVTDPDTAEFKQYIGASQWRNEDGSPKRFYHATASEFFDFIPAGQSQAIFLAETPEEAETFGSIAEDRLRRQIYKALNKDDKLEFFQGVVDKAIKEDKITQKMGDDFMRQAKRKMPEYGDFGDIEQETYDALIDLSPNRMRILPLYARAEMPFEFDNPEHVKAVMKWVANNTDYPQEFADKWLNALAGRIAQGLWQAIEDKRVQAGIRALDFDGFTVRENRASKKNYAVYKPQQVKSITGNDGQFDFETKDVRYSLKKVRYSDERFDKLWNESMYTQSNAENKTKGYLAFVDPMDFVRATASPETFENLLKEKEPLNIERLKAYDQVPYLSVSEKNGEWKITGHEGRHRMLALHDAGYREIPVYIHLRSENAKSLSGKFLEAQYENSVSPMLWARDIEPLSYSNRNEARAKFTRLDSKPTKYSLPNLSSATKTRINEVAPQRYNPTWQQRVIGAFKQDYTGLRQRFLNRYEALASADRRLREKMKAAGGPDLLADQSAEFAALQSDLSAGVAASAMGIGDRQGGVPVYRNGVTTIDTSVKGLTEALAPLAQQGDPEVYQRYQFWAGWKRGRRLLREGKEQVYTPADAKIAQEIENAHPEFVQVQKDLIAFNNGIVNFAVQTGVLSRERAQVYTQYADYIPFYRQLDLDKTIGPNPFTGISGIKGPKAIKGGESPLGDFMENMVRNTQSMINAGMKNAAAQRATKVAMSLNEVQQLPRATAGVGYDVYTVLENGELTYYRSGDPLFIDALKSLNMPDLPFMGILSAPANALRNLVTKDPGFMLANLLRDSLSSYVTSGQNVTPIVGTMVNFGKALSGKDKNLQALFNAGVIGGYEFSQNIQQSGESLSKDLSKKAGTDAKLLRPFKSLWEGLEKGTTASDAATRMAVYERVMKETGNEAEAISRALEVMNFNRKGSSVLIRIATAALPFFNARLQGLDLFYRASTGRMDTQDAQEIKRKFWVRGMTMAALSAMYYMSVAGDDEYEKQEKETKENNWIFPSLGIRIPIPFEVGTLFKTMPERITAYMMGKATGEELMDTTKRALLNTFAFNPIPQTFKPLIEVATNYNFFTMRNIVGQDMQDVAPQYQVGPGTSKTAEWLGEKLGVSPMKLDQLIKGYSGTMGGYVIDVVDAMANEFSDVPKASKRLEQMPIIKRFVLDPEARGHVTEFYELQKSVDTFVRTANLLEKTARPEEYAKYVQENIGILAAKQSVRNIEKPMKELREMKKLINSMDIPPDDKRDMLTYLGRAESDLVVNIGALKKVVSELK